MSYLQKDQIEQFELEYDKIREELLTFGENEKVNSRKIELANLLEIARRVFLDFAETGKITINSL